MGRTAGGTPDADVNYVLAGTRGHEAKGRRDALTVRRGGFPR